MDEDDTERKTIIDDDDDDDSVDEYETALYTSFLSCVSNLDQGVCLSSKVLYTRHGVDAVILRDCSLMWRRIHSPADCENPSLILKIKCTILQFCNSLCLKTWRTDSCKSFVIECLNLSLTLFHQCAV